MAKYTLIEKEKGLKVDKSSYRKLFILVPKLLDKEMRAFRHHICSDKFNNAVIELLELGLEKAKEDGVIDTLKEKFLNL